MNHASDEKSKSITLMWPRKWWAPWRRGRRRRRRRRRRRHSPDPGEQLGFRLLIFFLISGRLIAIPHLDFFSCAFAFDSHWAAFQCCVLCTASLFPFIYIIYPNHLIYPFNWIVPHKGLPKIIKKSPTICYSPLAAVDWLNQIVAWEWPPFSLVFFVPKLLMKR